MRIWQRFTREDADNLQAALIERLGLDPGQLAADGITAEWFGGSAPVVLRWDGVATLTVAEFDALLEQARTLTDTTQDDAQDAPAAQGEG